MSLLQFLNECSDSYYKNSVSKIPDREFDKLKDLYEQQTGKSYERVGASLDSRFKKENHRYPMLSLEKVNTTQDLMKWAKNKTAHTYSLIFDWKLDGVSLSLIYVYGHLIKAVTRGNGAEGENVTHNAANVNGILSYVKNIADKAYVEIRGEIVISKENFAKMRLENPEFVSARNLASGSVRLKNPEESKNRNLDFIAYYIYGEDGLYTHLKEAYDLLIDWGFTIPYYQTLSITDHLIKYEYFIKNFENERESYPYEVDGLVIKISDKTVIKQLGTTSHHPKSAIAFKFEAEKSWTTLIGVEWSVSSTGRINPVGILNPVQIGDVTVGRVSLHNLDIINGLNLAINRQVLVARCNDVIPKIERCIIEDEGTPIELPTHCPDCSANTIKKDKFLYCLNTKCPKVLAEKIIKFANILEIKGIGNAVAENIAYQLTALKADYYNILQFEVVDFSFAAESDVLGTKIHKELLKAKENFTPVKALTSLFIEGVGSSVAEKILEKHNYKELPSKVQYLTYIDGIGSVLASNVCDFLQNNYEVYNYLMGYIMETTVTTEKHSNKLTGSSFCVTGVHPIGRTELEQLIKNNGGDVKSVSAKLDYLVAGDKAGGKLDKATKLGIKVISYDNVLELIEKV